MAVKRAIYINSVGPMTRIAVTEDGRPVELYIESDDRQRLLGNIYLGTVVRILPGMQAAFVDIGLERDAFLYVQDASPEGEFTNGALSSEEEDDPTLSDTEEVIAPYLKVPIDQILQHGQKLIVQIAREPQTMKGARITAHLTLPGRYLVLMPTVSHVGVSKRIESETERENLKLYVDQFRLPQYGVIVRTVAEGRTLEEITPDYHYLVDLWEKIQIKAKRVKAPALLYQDIDPISRVLRDLFADSIDHVIIDSYKDYERCKEFVASFAPHLIDRIQHYSDKTAIFEKYKIESELEKALQRKVWLPSGGFLVFDQTEAMVSIDINTGRYTGKENFEETVFQTNLEATKSIAHQVRLRDLSGIIVIDFIDMEQQEHRDTVLEALINAFSNDRAKVNIHPFTALGLVEMTRKRLKRTLQGVLMQSCPYCHGFGMIRHAQTVANQLYCELSSLINTLNFNTLEVVINPVVGEYIDDHFEKLRELASRSGKEVKFTRDREMHIENYDILRR